MKFSQTFRTLRTRQRLVPVIALAAAAFCSPSQAAVVYDFNSLTPGALNGQDGWSTTLFNTTSDAQVVAGFGSDGTQALKFDKSGGGVGVNISHVDTPLFDLPSFGTGQAYIEYEDRINAWGSWMYLGADLNSNSKIDSTETAMRVRVDTVQNRILYEDATGSGTTQVSLSALGITGNWIGLRWEMDFDTGLMDVLYRDPLLGGAFIEVAGLQGLDMALNGSASDATNAANWNGIVYHIEGATGGLDNFAAGEIVTSSVPVPAPLASMMLVGLTAWGASRRRKA